MAKMETSYTRGNGQEIPPTLVNTAKDGTGTWYVPLVDSSGRLIMGVSTSRVGTVSGVCKTVRVTKELAAAGDYAAEDVLSQSASAGTAWTWAGIFRANNTGGYITKVMVICETTALTPKLTLYLFNATPTSNLNDNAANVAPAHADKAKFIGIVELPAMSDMGGNSVATATSSTAGVLPLWVDAATTADDLIAIVATQDAITGESATMELTIDITLEQY